jgi:hypothetical protein
MAEPFVPPDRYPEIFPRAVQPRVFRSLWFLLALLLIALTVLGVQYARIAEW